MGNWLFGFETCHTIVFFDITIALNAHQLLVSLSAYIIIMVLSCLEI